MMPTRRSASVAAEALLVAGRSSGGRKQDNECAPPQIVRIAVPPQASPVQTGRSPGLTLRTHKREPLYEPLRSQLDEEVWRSTQPLRGAWRQTLYGAGGCRRTPGGREGFLE
jgi:hypothetical protein